MTKRNKVEDRGAVQLYASVPVALARDGKLSHTARSVALYVWSHDERFGQSRNDVADALGAGRNNVGRALDELQERGWLVRNPAERIWYRQRANTPFTDDEIRELSEGEPGPERTHFPPSGYGADPLSGYGADPVTGSGAYPRSSTGRSAPEVHFPRRSGTETGSGADPVGIGEIQESALRADHGQGTVTSFEARPIHENSTEGDSFAVADDERSSSQEPEGSPSVQPPTASEASPSLTDEEIAELMDEVRLQDPSPEDRLLTAIRTNGSVRAKSGLAALMGVDQAEVNAIVPRLIAEGTILHDKSGEHPLLTLA